MDPRIETINGITARLKERLEGRQPELGIVLGSGLGSLAESIENPIVVPYRELPGFPVSTATGHKGNFIVGTLGGKMVIAMQGRIHYYEGYWLRHQTPLCFQRRRRHQPGLPCGRPHDYPGPHQSAAQSAYRPQF